MARQKKFRLPKPPRAYSLSAPARKSVLRQFFSRVFCRRNIIILSEHKTQHVPVHPLLQISLLSGFVIFVTWVAYSTGSYVTAQQVLEEKNRKLANASQEKERIGAEFALLRRDLANVLNKGKAGKQADYAKLVQEQYAQGAAPQPVDLATLDKDAANKESTGDDAADQQNAAIAPIIARVEFLENKVQELQEVHDGMIADIRTTTGGKIKELETIIAKTGVKSAPLVRSAEIKVKREEQARARYNRTGDFKADAESNVDGAVDAGDGKGGPYEPVSTTSMLRDRDTDLYFNLKRMMVLNEVVSAMPLAQPIHSARQTSGFGTRIDPFNGRLARHTGLDFAGSYGSPILASADGVVKTAGWQAGYGKAVDVVHGYGFSTKYGHLSAVSVKPGQHVKKGQVIGREGSSGRSTGSHLHYEVRYNDTPLNPKNFLTARR
jgi:murein DD-endopeptidase MepM/ murein hydrolase activator NlpD